MRKLICIFTVSAMLILASCTRNDDIEPRYFFEDKSLLYGESLFLYNPLHVASAL